MGTRSTIKFYRNKHNEKPNVCVASIYQQYDGYLSGIGNFLIQWLNKFTIVNGISLNDDRKIANGIDCLAAQYIRDHKNGVGGLYMTHEDDMQEYNYEIYDEDEKGLYIIVKDDGWNKTQQVILLEGYLNKINIDDAIKKYE
jgi:acetyltransferase-like isoleucine patch superfamily enzyme